MGESCVARRIPPFNCWNVSFYLNSIKAYLLTSKGFMTTKTESNLRNQKLVAENLVPQLTTLMLGGELAYRSETDLWEPDWQQVLYNYKHGVRIQTEAFAERPKLAEEISAASQLTANITGWPFEYL
ncbi:hypothetical protein BDV95DRAFT_595693 [Massariosphaeria phaeospora]|uniref:Uncharacterized protein n=1 Tax=Massariosphaeria phaeospora TaxID=100035 RepID=A0A7C8M7V0_9PLEO|nr:hypothetical protein BDV95DRAFT_595693 [Massariosphaeria phaeospora]